MARIKAVLQERRLGLLAAVAPHTERRSPMPGWVDPMRTQDAQWGKTQVRDVTVPRLLRLIKAEKRSKGRLRRKARAEDAGQAEVESKDEGFGGGEEAQRFVNKTDVDQDGHVRQA